METRLAVLGAEDEGPSFLLGYCHVWFGHSIAGCFVGGGWLVCLLRLLRGVCIVVGLLGCDIEVEES